VAKRQEKKRQQSKPVQPPLPGMPPPEPLGTTRVFPMQLQVGDKLTDETGQWEMVDRPRTTGGGKKTEARATSRQARPDGDENVGLLREGRGETALARFLMRAGLG